MEKGYKSRKVIKGESGKYGIKAVSMYKLLKGKSRHLLMYIHGTEWKTSGNRSEGSKSGSHEGPEVGSRFHQVKQNYQLQGGPGVSRSLGGTISYREVSTELAITSTHVKFSPVGQATGHLLAQ